MMKKFNEFTNESLKDKMVGKTDEEVRNNLKQSIGVDDDIVSVRVWNPDEYKLVSSSSVLTAKYLDSYHYAITGDIIKVIEWLEDWVGGSIYKAIHYLKSNIIKDKSMGSFD